MMAAAVGDAILGFGIVKRAEEAMELCLLVVGEAEGGVRWISEAATRRLDRHDRVLPFTGKLLQL